MNKELLEQIISIIKKQGESAGGKTNGQQVTEFFGDEQLFKTYIGAILAVSKVSVEDAFSVGLSMVQLAYEKGRADLVKEVTVTEAEKHEPEKPQA